jgi:peptidoglycan/LPS O-acetylase OafA/YrhL
MTTPSLRSRVLVIDLIKAVAAQLIVLHHLAWFGFLSDPALALGGGFAAVMHWLEQYGRYAVAIFIVTSGFLAAQFLPMHGLHPGDTPGCLIRDRYFRLAGPFAVAMLLAVAANLLARQWMNDEALGTVPAVSQFLAHVLMLQGLLDVESLSAGVWYVMIDFQLYVLFVLLLWLGQRMRHLATADFLPAVVVLAVALASLFHFNRDARLDDTAFYFFGAYALGIGAGWAIRSGHRKRFRLLITVVGLLALWIEFRARIAVSLITALILGFGLLHLKRREVRIVHYLGGTSYALFLVHYPIYMLVAGVFHRMGLTAPEQAVAGLVLTWAVSMVAADLFHRQVELPFNRWRKRRLLCRSGQ